MIVTLTWPPPPSHMVMSALADVRTGLLMEVLGANAQVRSGSAGEVLAGRIERAHRAALILTFGGGTNEIQRDIIAAAGLGLPPARR